jgi:hypothetical protein
MANSVPGSPKYFSLDPSLLLLPYKILNPSSFLLLLPLFFLFLRPSSSFFLLLPPSSFLLPPPSSSFLLPPKWFVAYTSLLPASTDTPENLKFQ